MLEKNKGAWGRIWFECSTVLNRHSIKEVEVEELVVCRQTHTDCDTIKSKAGFPVNTASETTNLSLL